MKGHLFSLEEALSLGLKDVRENYGQYINPALAGLMALVGFDKQFVRAQGMYVWDSEGNRYLDFVGAYGALNLGHNPQEILEALEKVRDLPNLLQVAMGTLAAALAHNLAAVAPGKLAQTFFCNSGAEAVEGALKLARASTGRQEFVSCSGSFHGKSMGALSVSGREKYQKPFLPLVPGCRLVPYGDLEALQEALRVEKAAAFIVEPIQGEGGIIVPPDGYLKGARELCSRYGTLLILDEVQTGLGRTGYLFACEYEGVEPDMLCLAKSLGGGVMPVGAYITAPEIWNKAYGGMERCLLHTSTFGGNTRAMAAGLAALNTILERSLSEEARSKGEYFLGRLRELQGRYPLLKEVRGRGLLVGLEFEQPSGLVNRLTGGLLGKLSQEYLASMVAGELLNRHRIITVYTLNNPNVIRLEPPLIVSRQELDEVVEALEKTLSAGGLGITLQGGKTAFASFLRR